MPGLAVEGRGRQEHKGGQLAGAQRRVSAVLAEIARRARQPHDAVFPAGQQLQDVLLVVLAQAQRAAEIRLVEQARIGQALPRRLRQTPRRQNGEVHLLRQAEHREGQTVSVPLHPGVGEVSALGQSHAVERLEGGGVRIGKAERRQQAEIVKALFAQIAVRC